MAFEKFKRTQNNVVQSAELPLISISRFRRLYFNVVCTHLYFTDKDKVLLYYDKGKNIIDMKPIKKKNKDTLYHYTQKPDRDNYKCMYKLSLIILI